MKFKLLGTVNWILLNFLGLVIIEQFEMSDDGKIVTVGWRLGRRKEIGY